MINKTTINALSVSSYQKYILGLSWLLYKTPNDEIARQLFHSAFIFVLFCKTYFFVLFLSSQKRSHRVAPLSLVKEMKPVKVMISFSLLCYIDSLFVVELCSTLAQI